MLQAIAFDVGDTLVEYEGLPLSWEQHYPDALHRFAAAFGIACVPAQIDRGCATLRRFNTRLNPRTHEISFSEIATELALDLGCPPATDELACARVFFRVFRQRLRGFPDARPALDRLRARGGRIGAFTDAPYGMPRELVIEDLRETGLLDAFDVFLTSRDVGFRKPHVATLQRLAEILRCDPTDMAYVGNEKKDIDVARAFGCQAVLIDRNGTGPGWNQDRTIASLDEL